MLDDDNYTFPQYYQEKNCRHCGLIVTGAAADATAAATAKALTVAAWTHLHAQ